MIVVLKDSRPGELSEARSILLVHQPEASMGGLCGGCYEFACRFAWWPCPYVRWAQAVVAADNGGEPGSEAVDFTRAWGKDVARQRIYEALLAEPDRNWTVFGMAEVLPGLALNDVRTTLHLLLGDRLVDIEPVARQRSLTLRLTDDGGQILAGILRGWEADQATLPAPAGRDVQ